MTERANGKINFKVTRFPEKIFDSYDLIIDSEKNLKRWFNRLDEKAQSRLAMEYGKVAEGMKDTMACLRNLLVETYTLSAEVIGEEIRTKQREG